ncbi:hypothetical protein [Dawidia soli]|uniref:Uncharacterized protein n=1 Tax=Dawidia soli TaxID=2782352 RepID=A0AAP2DCX6_9BACT|nr:hypothetical protein [Dawidia soli]MBT1689443.1 hypothetical protein [Dawidia soli]
MFGLFTANKKLPERSLDEIKQICKVLFIDDKNFPLIEILKTAGWVNTRRIKDVDSLDQSEVRESHIMFVDIQGVGKRLKFHDEGLGLIVALKTKYPSKKIIAYSAEDQGQVQAFSDGINMADSRMSKNADPYQFQFLVEKFAKEAFSLNECIERIKQLLIKEIGRSVESDAILKKLTKIATSKNFSVDEVGKVFNLQNAANVSSVIQLFLTGGG